MVQFGLRNINLWRSSKLSPDDDVFDEDKYTIKYMEKYGINNVRSGSFVTIKLSDSNVSTLEQIMKSVNDKCFICGSTEHFASECKPIPAVVVWCECPASLFKKHRVSKCLLKKIVKFFEDEDDNIDILKMKAVCNRCGRNTHDHKNCYAKTHIKGYIIM